MSDEVEPPGKKNKALESKRQNQPPPSASYLTEELNKLQKAIFSLIAESKQNFNLEEFLSSKISKLGSLIGHYYQVLTALEVPGRKELNALIGQQYSDPGIQDSAEMLMEAEEEFDDFLRSVDRQMVDEKDVEVTLGGKAPLHLNLVDVEWNRDTSLGDILSSVSPKHLVMILLRHFA